MTEPKGDARPPGSLRHEAERSRFLWSIGGGPPAELMYRATPDSITFIHTGVPAALTHQGIGAALVRGGLDWALADGRSVRATCPFVIAFVRRHPEYQGRVQIPKLRVSSRPARKR